MIAPPFLDTWCINCMKIKGDNQYLCPSCGYDERRHQGHPLYLKPRMVLKKQYFVGEVLGQGGFGITYIGLDSWLQKKIAIKEFLPSTLATRDFLTSVVVPVKKQEEAFQDGLKLFINEARNLAKFDHPNIVRVINFFEENQTAYMVMEYLEGDNLMAILNQTGGRLPVPTALAIVLPILDALMEIHANRVYHLDISIQNIILLKTGVPILIDFGAARHIIGEYSHNLELVLKPGYSPLEQYSGKGKIGPWSDIYACGALLYLLITGHLPPGATDRFSKDTLLAPREMTGLDIPHSVNQAIIQALALKWEERFQNVQELKAALQGQWPIYSKVSLPTPVPKISLELRLSIILTLLLIPSSFSWFKPPISQIPALFEKIPMQWANSQLTSPPGDNAYETYQHILAIDPQNTQAKLGISKIIQHYEELARLAQAQNHLTESLTMLRQGLQIQPNRPELQELQQTILNSLAEQQKAQLRARQLKELMDKATHYLINLQLEAAYATYQQVMALVPNHPEARAGLQQVAEKYVQLARQKKNHLALAIIKQALGLFPTHPELLALQREITEKLTQQRTIEELLSQAQQQRVTLRLTEPQGDNAYETYQQILKIAPDHLEAQQGIIKIADEYERLASIKPQDPQKSRILVDKGLKLLPNHVGLLALRQELEKPKKLPLEAPPAVKSPPALVTDNIQSLLTTAQQQLAAAQWEKAGQTYQEVLKLEATNAQAQAGLHQIAQHYEQLARQPGSLSESLTLVQKGLLIYPTHQGLLVLQKELEHRLQNEQTKSSNIIFTPSF